jgi:hypothetical protein
LGIIRNILTAQGVSEIDDDLDRLVQIKTWKESCFEFAHFTDEEIVKGFRQMDTDCGHLADNKILDVLQTLRAERKDIKKIWKGWKPQPRKTDLIDVLWPVLEEKIRSAIKNEGPLPQIADRVYEAWDIAHQNRHLQFALRAKEAAPE